MASAGRPIIRLYSMRFASMETTGAVGDDTGWLPHHLVMYDDDHLVAAMHCMKSITGRANMCSIGHGMRLPRYGLLLP